MPILELQRRLREIGRIRIGEQRVSTNGKKYPAKLATFRFTSQDGRVVDAAAQAFGGTTQPWPDAPTGEQWQVITNTSTLNVIVPPGGMAFSQYYEQWSAGGCQKRCDGQWDNINDQACTCDPSERECKPHTRLSIILPELQGLGVWRLDTSGYYAAVELSGVVQVCEQASEHGRMLPARLMIEEREVKRTVDGKVETRKFGVPVLDVDLNLADLLTRRSAAELAPAHPAVTSHPVFTPVPVSELPAAFAPSIADQAAAMAEPTQRPKRKNAQTPIPRTTVKTRTAAEAAPSNGHVHAPGYDELARRVEILTGRSRAMFRAQANDLKLPQIEWTTKWGPDEIAQADKLLDEIAGPVTVTAPAAQEFAAGEEPFL